MQHPQFSRRTSPPAVRWAAAGAAAVLLHIGALALLSLWPQAPSSKKKIPVDRQYLVHLQHSKAEDKKITPISDRVSTETHAAAKETKTEKLHDHPPASARRSSPRRSPLPPAPVSVVPAPAPEPGSAAAQEARPPESASQPETAMGPIKLFPTEQETQKILGIEPEITPPDVASGSENAINSRKWIGASFFLRVREAVARSWNPEPVYRAQDPDGRVYGYKNWLTVLTITLDAHGNLLEPIIISQPSGLRFLDLEAIRAVRAAAPFLNPPAEIVDANGRIKFRFGFLVEVNAGMNFRMFRF